MYEDSSPNTRPHDSWQDVVAQQNAFQLLNASVSCHRTIAHSLVAVMFVAKNFYVYFVHSFSNHSITECLTAR